MILYELGLGVLLTLVLGFPLFFIVLFLFVGSGAILMAKSEERKNTLINANNDIKDKYVILPNPPKIINEYTLVKGDYSIFKTSEIMTTRDLLMQFERVKKNRLSPNLSRLSNTYTDKELTAIFLKLYKMHMIEFVEKK